MSLVDRQRRIEEDVQLAMLDEKRHGLGCLPEDLFPLLEILDQPGDYCLSTTEANHPRVSIKDDRGDVQHLVLEKHAKSQLRVKGMLFGTGATVGELLYNLRTPAFDILSSLLAAPISFRRLVTMKDLKGKVLLNKDHVKNMALKVQDDKYKHFVAEVPIAGKMVNCELVQSRDMSVYDWRRRMFTELRVALVAEQKQLPIYAPFALVSSLDELGYLVYRELNVTRLDYYAQNLLPSMDVAARLRLMLGIASVMAELHHAGMFHGALQMQHFVVLDDGDRLLFNGGDGLAPTAAHKTITLADHSSALAPEVSWSRRLTPSSGVYSLGRLLQQLSTMSTEAIAKDPHAGQLQTVTAVISRCLSRRPGSRPTMDGIYLRLKDARLACQK